MTIVIEGTSLFIVGKFYTNQEKRRHDSFFSFDFKKKFLFGTISAYNMAGIFGKPDLHEAIVGLRYVDEISLRQYRCKLGFCQ
jgi:hypothetical protein